jgi:hypothetical protein
MATDIDLVLGGDELIPKTMEEDLRMKIMEVRMDTVLGVTAEGSIWRIDRFEMEMERKEEERKKGKEKKRREKRKNVNMEERIVMERIVFSIVIEIVLYLIDLTPAFLRVLEVRRTVMTMMMDWR